MLLCMLIQSIMATHKVLTTFGNTNGSAISRVRNTAKSMLPATSEECYRPSDQPHVFCTLARRPIASSEQAVPDSLEMHRAPQITYIHASQKK